MMELTKAEEQVMHVLWKLEKGFVKDVLNEMPEPKPAYNTVSTIIRILEKKQFVGYKAYGKSHEYFPLVTMEAYSDFMVNKVASSYFEGSFKSMLSFFMERNKIDTKELDEVLKLIEHQTKK